jgi:twinkle protein
VAHQCLAKLPHSCGTRSGLQVFAREDGGVDGYCFSCGVFVRHPFGEPKEASELPRPKEKTQEEIDNEILEISSYPTVTVERKKLRDIYLDYFGIKTAVSEEDGKTPIELCYPYTKDGVLVGWKVKSLMLDPEGKKRMWSLGKLSKEVDLFGWEQALATGSKKIIITEGEDDSVALRSIIERNTKADFADYKPAICSLPHGAASAHNDLQRLKQKIDKHFKEVVFCFDMDEAGQKAAEKCMLVFPNAKVANLPRKDANQCLIDGMGKAAFNAVTFNATTPKNTRLVFGEAIHDEAREIPSWGDLSWPWEHLNQATRGIRYGETIYIGAGVKMGKSELLNALAAHFIKECGVKVFMAKPEEANKKTYKLLAGKIVGRIFHDPKVDFDYEAYDRAGQVLAGKLAMVNLYQHLGWESLKDDILSAVNWGAKVVFIDPITNLTNGDNAGDANSKLQEIAQSLAAMAHDHQIVIILFCHLKAPEGNIEKSRREKFYHDGKYIGLGNCPHEMGGDIYSSQFAGSRAMMRSCNLMIGLEGNKDDSIPEEARNVRNLKLLEDREFGETGTFPIYWNRDTSLFVEM